MLRLVVTLLTVAVVVVAISMMTASHHGGPPRVAVSRPVRRLSSRHAGEPGMIVEVLWPVGWIYASHTVESVRISERTLLGAVQR